MFLQNINTSQKKTTFLHETLQNLQSINIILGIKCILFLTHTFKLTLSPLAVKLDISVKLENFFFKFRRYTVRFVKL